MNTAKQIPHYAPDGTSLGFRSMEASKRLIEVGYVKPSYGRKGHLKAIWLQKQDGSSPVETHDRTGTRYSLLENMESGRFWKLRRLDLRDEDGVRFSTRHVFMQVTQGFVWRHEMAAAEGRWSLHRLGSWSVRKVS